jgi:hypothetical protein
VWGGFYPRRPAASTAFFEAFSAAVSARRLAHFYVATIFEFTEGSSAQQAVF